MRFDGPSKRLAKEGPMTVYLPNPVTGGVVPVEVVEIESE